MINARTTLLILGAVAFSAAGQLLLKSGAQRLSTFNRSEFLFAAARDATVLAGIAAWIASTVCWLFVLRVAPLSRAYLLTSLTYVIIPAAGVIMFGEQFRRMHFAGTVLILVGIALLLSAE